MSHSHAHTVDHADSTASDLRSPVSSLSAEEIARAGEIVRAAGLANPTVRFAYVGLSEPHKSDVLRFRAGEGVAPTRRARVQLLDTKDGASIDAIVDLDAARVDSATHIDPAEGRLPVLVEEFHALGDLLADDADWVKALDRRDLKPEDVVVTLLSAGSYDLPGEEGKRIMRALAFLYQDEDDHPWAHPIDGISVYIDAIQRTVIQVVDHEILPIPQEPSKFHRAEGRPAPLELKPIEITQPEGPSYHVDGDRVSWANWSFSLGFDAREGLILHDLSFADPDHDGEVRPIIYRASIAEMVVPYADPSPVRFWQNYFDTGEYLFGRFTNSLSLGCDCLGEIRYFDATVADEFGNPRVIPNAICLHEEDYGTLWKHTDVFVPGVNEVRRQRRLVVSFFTTVGNYDYGFYWHLYLDGKIELEAKLTGILFPSSYKGFEEWPYASEVAPGLGAPFHQHLFSARLDMMVDGVANAVDEVDAVRVPVSDENPHGNAFSYRRTRIASESEAARGADASVGRTWHIVSTDRTNKVGGPTGYALHADQQPMLLADASSNIAARAAFTTKEMWVTAYSPDERYPAGEHVNQSPVGSGLPQYQLADRPLDGTDLVVWHTFGLTHFPRPEDWPVMPVDHIGFALTPYGFFDRNPALNAPETPPEACHPEDDHGSHDHHH